VPREKPILMSAPMMRAILRDVNPKTQTRHVVMPQPWVNKVGQWQWERRPGKHIAFHPDLDEKHYPGTKLQHACPYGQPGDRLWAITIRPIIGYEDRYGVGDDGLVYRLGENGPKPLRGVKASKGHLRVTLRKGKAIRNVFIHRLVCEAFYGPPPSPKHEVRHIDDTPANNAATNLDWGTVADNTADRISAGRGSGEGHPRAKLTSEQVAEIISSNERTNSVARRLEVSHATISHIRSGRSWAKPIPERRPPNCERWKPLMLEVTAVRVEQIQEMSEDDAISEGWPKAGGDFSTAPGNGGPFDWYRELWDSLNARRGDPWRVNPWVWVRSFRRVQG
jgi:hypothetical protein